MKRIIYLTFYFEPDLCAGSFRNSPLAIELAKKASNDNVNIEVYTTLPNRYSSFEKSAPMFEEFGNLKIHRIILPPHKGGMLDQALSFRKYFFEVLRLNKNKKADLVFASSSRLFTAYLGFLLSKKINAPLYLDIRDIFVDAMSDILKPRIFKYGVLVFLKLIERKTFKNAQHINLISSGFKEYFSRYNKSRYTFYTNGIDEEFLTLSQYPFSNKKNQQKKTIVYAGNIGEGQGLHKIIPQTAKLLGDDFEFHIFGDGGCKKLLQYEIKNLQLNNVFLYNPVNRSDLVSIYNDSDYLFLHLNDHPALRKVLPSKIFEMSTFNKTIIAGVSGYAADFIRNEISSSFVFDPCNISQLVDFLKFDIPSNITERKYFKIKYRRSNIVNKMVDSILSYI